MNKNTKRKKWYKNVHDTEHLILWFSDMVVEPYILSGYRLTFVYVIIVYDLLSLSGFFNTPYTKEVSLPLLIYFILIFYKKNICLKMYFIVSV